MSRRVPGNVTYILMLLTIVGLCGCATQSSVQGKEAPYSFFHYGITTAGGDTVEHYYQHHHVDERTVVKQKYVYRVERAADGKDQQHHHHYHDLNVEPPSKREHHDQAHARVHGNELSSSRLKTEHHKS